jgi:anthranilate synthase/aminodeoxychorismate synthase-like glutamine amidotransferase
MILIIDNYDSFTYNLVHLVGRHTDELEVVRNDDLSLDEVKARAPDGILISPGPGRPAEAGITEPVIRELGETTPILGVCLGHQAIGEVFGGKIVQADELMHGKTSPVKHDGKGIFERIDPTFDATRYHSLVVDRDSFPHDALEITAEAENGTIMGLQHRTYPLHGIQFHPESVMTKPGPKIVENWLGLVWDDERLSPAT